MSPTSAVSVACVEPGYPAVVGADGETIEPAQAPARLQAYLLSASRGFEDQVTDISYRVSNAAHQPAGDCSELSNWAAEWDGHVQTWMAEGQIWKPLGAILTVDEICEFPPARRPRRVPQGLAPVSPGRDTRRRLVGKAAFGAALVLLGLLAPVESTLSGPVGGGLGSSGLGSSNAWAQSVSVQSGTPDPCPAGVYPEQRPVPGRAARVPDQPARPDPSDAALHRVHRVLRGDGHTGGEPGRVRGLRSSLAGIHGDRRRDDLPCLAVAHLRDRVSH